ncbi:hypothetical protein [Clostridium fungisolvens]|uniref:Uncharacterized protein n=1 Tax=Clostridium fungisolvens TaxID=1604897 RepID=A0A6V8SDR5_9CLOT|nr:hypothetical protein [Clostridium fungisolvens]GFP75384.1 hypothetical protein bsdtw1_01461 [Clostridium fungisolvens]
MNWYHLLKNISILGGICSIFIAIVGFVLLLSALKSAKYEGKLVKETPLLKYAVVLSTGVILTILFQIIIFILKFFERT